MAIKTTALEDLTRQQVSDKAIDKMSQTGGGRAAPETYKTGPNRLTRGGLGVVKKDAFGNELPRTGYGDNQWSGASSAGVAESNRLSDLDATNDDPILNDIAANGLHREKQGDWQLRDIGKQNVGDSVGMASARSRQPSSGNAEKIPTSPVWNEEQPVRQPPSK